MTNLNLALLGLLLSIIYSGSEIALLTSNALQIDVWKKQKKPLAKLASSILDAKILYMAIILIGTNLSNIIATSFATAYLLEKQFMPPHLIIIPITCCILLIGEILPKSVLRTYSNIGLIVLSPFLKFTYLLCLPFLSLIKKIDWIVIPKENNKRGEIEYVYEQADDFEAMKKNQKLMISKLFKSSTNKVQDAMTPRTEISAISSESNLENAIHAFIDSGHSKLPVYKNSLDNIIGVIYLYDLFHKPEKLKDIIKPVLFVPYTKPILELMNEFQKEHHSLAMILDEHGGTEGLITVEDVFEELFGDFEDEFDEEMIIQKLKEDGSILVSGRMDCDNFNSKNNNLIPIGQYETIAGYIIFNIGRIPNMGEKIFLPIGQIEIKKSSARKIELVRIFPNQN